MVATSKCTFFCSFTDISDFHIFSEQCPGLHRLSQGMESLCWSVRACVKATLLPGLLWPENRWSQPPEAKTATAGTREVNRNSSKNHCLPNNSLFRMIHKDSFTSARVLTERMRNLYGVRVGRKTFNNRLVTRGYYARRILRKPPLTANHRHLRLDWARLPGERFQQDCQAAGVQVGGGSVHLWGTSTGAPNHSCAPR